MTHPDRKISEGFMPAVRSLRRGDLDRVTSILKACVIDDETGRVLLDEIEEITERMQKSINGVEECSFFVAKAGQEGIVGIVGVRNPEDQLASFIRPGGALEAIHLFVDPSAQRKGTGRKLMVAVEEQARKAGCMQVLVSSGPRYKKAWVFYDNLLGYSQVGSIPNRFGEGINAQVWKKDLYQGP